VYLGRLPAAGARPVALKVLHPDHRDTQHVARLHREFELAARLPHRHVIDVYDRGQHWLAMRYLDGGNANQLGTVEDRMTALAQIADALDYIHRQGIVHCDVKPANILIPQDFSSTAGAILIDFGVAHSVAEDIAPRLTHDPGQCFSLDPAKRITHQRVDRQAPVEASLPYAAPEQLLGRLPSAATDQYALACTAVELITGRPPFTATTPQALMDAQLHELTPRISDRIPWLPHAFDIVVSRAMAKDPDRRYDGCVDLVDRLTRTLKGERTG
jgi:serine/threonine-protein kinase